MPEKPPFQPLPLAGTRRRSKESVQKRSITIRITSDLFNAFAAHGISVQLWVETAAREMFAKAGIDIGKKEPIVL